MTAQALNPNPSPRPPPGKAVGEAAIPPFLAIDLVLFSGMVSRPRLRPAFREFARWGIFPLLVRCGVSGLLLIPAGATTTEKPSTTQTRPYTEKGLKFEPPITKDDANPVKPYYDTSLTKAQRDREMERRFLVLAHSKFAEDRAWAAMVNSDLISQVLKTETALDNLRILLRDPEPGVRNAALAGFNSCTGYRENFGRAAIPLFKEFLNDPDPETRKSIRSLYFYYKFPDKYAAQQGVRDAQKALEEEIYGICVLGDETGWKAKWVEKLEGEGLEVNWVPSTPDRPAYMTAYNDTVRAALRKKHGYDLLATAEATVKSDLHQQRTGRQKAKADMGKGKFQLIEYGLPADNAEAYWTALATRYGVAIQGEGCVTTQKELAFSSGYNEAVRTALEAKYGKDVLADLEKEFFPPQTKDKTQAAKDGEAAATADLKERRFYVYDDIAEPRWKPAYREILKQIGIEVLDWQKVAAEKGGDYCGGYDDVSEAAIRNQFGKYVLDRAKAKAQRQFEASGKSP